MRYISTRGSAPVLEFEDVVLTGLARDGGLYVPESWPRWQRHDFAALKAKSYSEIAYAVIAPFVGDAVPADDLREMIEATYADFGHPDVTPLRQLGDNQWLLELFHGPTLAFKDLALQLLGRLFDYFLKRCGGTLTIVGATSGDTGSAAIEACRGREMLQIFMLHPEGRVSNVQRRQMTTVSESNVHNIAVAGTFDDCQALVKAMFDDTEFRDSHHLGAVNSINWARVMAQVVYYVAAGLQVGAPERGISFAVPTGNFGDVFAGFVAREMGFPIDRLYVGTNRNDILARFFDTGEYRSGSVTPTISPSMDIQVSSNFERLLFELCGRDGDEVSRLMNDQKTNGGFAVTADQLSNAQKIFAAQSVSEIETQATIKAEWERAGKFIDPHTAVGIAAGRACHGDSASPLVYLGTADAAKFSDAVENATGSRPKLPDRLNDLFQREERFDTLPNDLTAVEAHIAKRSNA
jgi:threonine synthase